MLTLILFICALCIAPSLTVFGLLVWGCYALAGIWGLIIFGLLFFIGNNS